MPELIAAVMAALFGALKPALSEILKQWSSHAPLAFESEAGKFILKFAGLKPKQANDTASLLGELSKTASQMDAIIAEIGRVTAERQSKILKLESDVTLLSQREEEIKARIEGLEKTPLPAAEYFAKLVEKSEKKSQIRDYMLFLGGVIVTAVIAVVLKKLGWA
jgi:hypothetical protein